MSRINAVFQELRTAGKKDFMPFVTAGDPDLEFTADLISELADKGCDVCEVGIPYSDPIADGQVIQASYTRALGKKIRLSEILDMLSRVSRDVKMPLVTMVSYAIVHRYGLKKYVA